MKLKKLSIAGAAAVLSALFCLWLGAAHAPAGLSQSASIDSPQPAASIFYGEPLQLGDGTVRSFVKLDVDGTPSDIGYTFSQAALSNLPDSPIFPTATVRINPPLPREAPATAFEHLELIYWKTGHDPDYPGIANLMQEHIDFVYFLISQEERDLICPHPSTTNTTAYRCTGDELAKVLKTPEPGAIPTNYIQVPNSITFYGLPRAGTAYFDPTDYTLDPFSQTVFYGFNEGQPDFIDVPISNALLKDFGTQAGGGTYTAPIKQPDGLLYPKAGYYPTTYTLTYDGVSEYTMSLSGLTFRSTSPTSVP